MEVKFEDENQGKVQVVASPLIRLTNKPNATIEDIGSPEKVIASLGPFVTGSTYDPDELLETSVEKRGDQTVLILYSFISYPLASSCPFQFPSGLLLLSLHALKKTYFCLHSKNTDVLPKKLMTLLCSTSEYL